MVSLICEPFHRMVITVLLPIDFQGGTLRYHHLFHISVPKTTTLLKSLTLLPTRKYEIMKVFFGYWINDHMRRSHDYHIALIREDKASTFRYIACLNQSYIAFDFVSSQLLEIVDIINDSFASLGFIPLIIKVRRLLNFFKLISNVVGH